MNTLVITKKRVLLAMAAIETGLAVLDVWLMVRDHRGVSHPRWLG